MDPGTSSAARPLLGHSGQSARHTTQRPAGTWARGSADEDLSGLRPAALRPGARPPLFRPYRRGHQGLRTDALARGDGHGDGALPRCPPPLRKAHTLRGPLRLTQAAEGRFYPNRAGQWTPRSPDPGHLQVSPWSVSRQTLAKDSEALDARGCLCCCQAQRAGQGPRAGSAPTPKRATR